MMTFDPTSYPYDTVVRITDTIGGVGYQASGVLISPDEVLTASHVVYSAGVGTASDIVVTPAYENGSAPYGSASGIYFHYFPVDDGNDQISNYESQFDYAVIHLSSSFPANGYMGLLANFSGGAVTIAGYPGSANGAMVASAQTVSLSPGYSLLDGIALGKGSSGGPVFVGGASNPQVVGIVSSTSDVSDAGYNALITTAAFNQIEQWVAGDDAAAVTPGSGVARQDGSVAVTGTHTQYLIANASGSLYFQDLVASRDGTQTVSGVDEIVFTDGVGRFDTTGNAEEVARLYGTAFGRSADLAGLNYWTHQIDSNTLQLGNISIAFINSAEFQNRYGTLSNQNFVEQLYRNALGRAGEASGVAYWTSQLNAGESKGSVLTAFSDSFENKLNTQTTIGDKDMSEVYRLYQAAFDRTPDTGGLEFWVGVLDSGASPSQVAQSMAGSAEFASIFAGLDARGETNLFYENALHRTGDPGGVNYWTGQIQGGASMGQVLLGFADSLENRIATASVTHDAWVYTNA
jgi:V8-like Glu-specific endopeptidase